MIEVRLYEKGDNLKLIGRNEVSPILEHMFIHCYGFTILFDGKIIALMGGAVMCAGIFQVFMVVSDDVQQCGKEFSLEVQEALDFHVSLLNLRKVYTMVDSESVRDIKWIERLGFKKEYVMVAAGPDGQDMFGYSIDYSNKED